MRQFSKHLALASEASYDYVSNVRRSEVADGFVFTFDHDSMEGPVDFQVILQDETGYLRDAKFMAFVDSECQPHFAQTIDILSDRIPGESSVEDVISFLSKGLVTALDENKPPDDMDEDDSFSADEYFQHASSPLGHLKSEDASQILKKSLLKAQMAGLHVGIFPPEPALIPQAISLSIKVKKLDLSEDAHEAWDLEPNDYLVLVLRPFSGYPSLPAYLRLPDDQTEMRFRFGKCATPKPSYESVRKALWNFEPHVTTCEKAGPRDKDQDASFSPNHMSVSINRLLNRSLQKLLILRRRHDLSWTGAQAALRATEQDDARHAMASSGSDRQDVIISQDAPADLQRDYALDVDEDFSIPLVAMQLALRHLVRCTEFCTVCYAKLDDPAGSMKPYACDSGLCMFQHLSLGFGVSLEHEIVHNPYVVDLLLSFFYAAVYAGRLREYPTGLTLKVPRLEAAETAVECDISLVRRPSGFLRPLYRRLIGDDHFVAAVLDHGDLKYYVCYITGATGQIYDFETLSGPHRFKSFDITRTLAKLFRRKAEDEWNNALLFPFIHDFEDLEPVQRDTALMMLMMAMPSVLDMRNYMQEQSRQGLSELSSLSKSARSLAQWVLATNRSHLVQDEAIPDAKVKMIKEPGVGNMMRFRFAQGAPDRERHFAQELKTHCNPFLMHSTLFAWHGSAPGNWHSIVRTGLDFQNELNGRAYGHGVYMSQYMATSINYSVATKDIARKLDSVPSIWPSSDLQPSKAISMVEVINRPDVFVSRAPHFVVDRVSWIQCRYLYIGVSPTSMALRDPSPGRQLRESVEWVPQDDNLYLVDMNDVPVSIPAEVIPISRRTQRLGPGCASRITFEPLDTKPTDQTADEGDDIVALLRVPDADETEKRGSKRPREASPSPSPDEQAGLVSKPMDMSSVLKYQPGSLNHNSLPRMPEPGYADSSPQALRALGKELKAVAQIQQKVTARERGWSIDVDQTDNMFRWIAELHSFDMDLPLAMDMKETNVSSVVLEIRFGPNFPMTPPFVRVIRPRFLSFAQGGGGHVTVGGAICSEMLTLSGWLPTLTVEKVLLQVRLGLCERELPARLHRGPYRDYGAVEAVHGYKRFVESHGWTPSPDLTKLASMGS
ncbi:hypothetical protein CDD80_1675 [Ophiocordyceps camponoti-rufipedis]|uniref:UBC core domain-containing protein n=1 Tax=Ophiocordyceps camponoti-rufipedis TaxID=2004952 RepID=A0A2C5Z901_9HYPO|nr:hypothetical protein CDD80_1675 [Ophiocordyceps camponoti-rufipedis]